MPLNNTICKNAKPAKAPYKLFDGQGLYLHVLPAGGKYWRLKYRFGKEKLLALGVYPQTSLLEAREATAAAKKLIAAGEDPGVAKQQKRLSALQRAGNSFESIAREWYARQEKVWSAGNRRKVLNRFVNDVFPHIGNMPIDSITAPTLLQVVRVIEKREAHEMAHRVVQYSGQVFRYAIATGRAERDPTRDMKGALQPYKSKHYAALNYKDLPQFFVDLEKSKMTPKTRLAVRLLLLTFVRTAELIRSKESEFDLVGKMWEIPAERMKMRRPHLVPLSRQAIAAIKELRALDSKNDYLIPSQYGVKKPLGSTTILKGLHEMGYAGRMTGHGFRALAATTLKEQLKYPQEVIDRQLSHVEKNKVRAAYNRAEHIEERKRMMQDWADFVDGIIKKTKIKKPA